MTTLNKTQLLEMLETAYLHFSHKIIKINNLNVFPVPDSDTGINMFLTIQNGINSMNEGTKDSIMTIMHDFSKGLLLGARGNSGVIFSQIFNGFYLYLFEGQIMEDTLTPLHFIKGFTRGTEEAYASVLKPIEGTILTVIRETVESYKGVKVNSFIDLFKGLIKTSKISLDNTPNILPLLKKANVVDSGGEGLYQFFIGMEKFLNGEKVTLNEQFEKLLNKKRKETFVNIDNEQYGYCTEGIIELKDPKLYDKKKVATDLQNKGCDSLVLVDSAEILKFHLHTFKPGEVLTYFQKLGEFTKLKIENMQHQVETHQIIELNSHEKFKQTSIKQNIATIMVGAGEGVYAIAKDLGFDYIIPGGVNNNPSLQDFILAMDSVNAENIILFPNDSNIYLVALQAQKHYSQANIEIIKTTNVVESLILSNYIDKNANIKDLIHDCNETLNVINYCFVTIAAKNIVLDGIKINKGAFLAIQKNKKILASEKTFIDLIEKIDEKFFNKKMDFITCLIGKELSFKDEESAKKHISDLGIEYEILTTGHPIYLVTFAYEAY